METTEGNDNEEGQGLNVIDHIKEFYTEQLGIPVRTVNAINVYAEGKAGLRYIRITPKNTGEIVVMHDKSARKEVEEKAKLDAYIDRLGWRNDSTKTMQRYMRRIYDAGFSFEHCRIMVADIYRLEFLRDNPQDQRYRDFENRFGVPPS